MAALEKVAEIAVDSGMVWLGDPVYSITPAADQWKEFVEKAIGLGFSEHGVAAFDSADAIGSLGLAVQTGGSDGAFPVYVRRDDDGLVMEVRIVFDA